MDGAVNVNMLDKECRRMLQLASFENVPKETLSSYLPNLLQLLEEELTFEKEPKCLHNACILTRRLLNDFPGEVQHCAKKWMPALFHLLVHSSPRIRFTALEVTKENLQMFAALAATTEPFLQLVELVPALLDLYRRNFKIHALQSWGCIVTVLGQALHKGTSINALLPLLEIAFKSATVKVCLEAYLAWEHLIENFAIDLNVFTNRKRLQLLITPIQMCQASDVTITEKKCHLWWLIILRLGERLGEHFDQVCVPLLDFCFPVCSTCLPADHTLVNHSTNCSMPGTSQTSHHPLDCDLPVRMLKASVHSAGCDIVLRLLEYPKSKGLSVQSPSKTPPLAVAPLAAPLPNVVFLKHLPVILESAEAVFVAQKMRPDLSSCPKVLSTLQHLVVRTVTTCQDDQEVGALAAGLARLFNHAVAQRLCLPSDLFKIIEDICRMPKKILFHGAASDASLLHFVVKWLLDPYLLPLSKKNERTYMALFSSAMSDRTGEVGSPMPFLRYVLEQLIQTDGTCDPVTSYTLWVSVASTVRDVVDRGGALSLMEKEMEQNVAHGDHLGCVASVLVYPVKHLLTYLSKRNNLKMAVKVWSALYNTFSLCAAMVTTTEANAACEDVSHALLELARCRNEVDSSDDAVNFVDVLSWLMDTMAEKIPPSSQMKSAAGSGPSTWNELRRRPLRNLTSFVHLLKDVLSRFRRYQAADVPCNKKPQLTAAGTKLVAIMQTLFDRANTAEAVRSLVEELCPVVARLFGDSHQAGGAANKAQFVSKLDHLWSAIINAINLRCSGSHGTEFLLSTCPLLEATLMHPRRTVRVNARRLWYTLFDRNYQSLSLPESLKLVLRKVSPPLLPGSEISPLEASASSESQTVGLPADFVPPSWGVKDHPVVSFLHKEVESVLSPKRRLEQQQNGSPKKRLLEEDNDEAFVRIRPLPESRRILTPHQKEMLKKKKHLPAMYVDLSQDSATIEDFSHEDSISVESQVSAVCTVDLSSKEDSSVGAVHHPLPADPESSDHAEMPHRRAAVPGLKDAAKGVSVERNPEDQLDGVAVASLDVDICHHTETVPHCRACLVMLQKLSKEEIDDFGKGSPDPDAVIQVMSAPNPVRRASPRSGKGTPNRSVRQPGKGRRRLSYMLPKASTVPSPDVQDIRDSEEIVPSSLDSVVPIQEELAPVGSIVLSSGSWSPVSTSSVLLKEMEKDEVREVATIQDIQSSDCDHTVVSTTPLERDEPLEQCGSKSGSSETLVENMVREERLSSMQEESSFPLPMQAQEVMDTYCISGENIGTSDAVVVSTHLDEVCGNTVSTSSDLVSTEERPIDAVNPDPGLDTSALRRSGRKVRKSKRAALSEQMEVLLQQSKIRPRKAGFALKSTAHQQSHTGPNVVWVTKDREDSEKSCLVEQRDSEDCNDKKQSVGLEMKQDPLASTLSDVGSDAAPTVRLSPNREISEVHSIVNEHLSLEPLESTISGEQKEDMASSVHHLMEQTASSSELAKSEQSVSDEQKQDENLDKLCSDSFGKIWRQATGRTVLCTQEPQKDMASVDSKRNLRSGATVHPSEILKKLTSSPHSRSQRILQAAIHGPSRGSKWHVAAQSQADAKLPRPNKKRAKYVPSSDVSPTSGILKKTVKKVNEVPSPPAKSCKVWFAEPLVQESADSTEDMEVTRTCSEGCEHSDPEDPAAGCRASALEAPICKTGLEESLFCNAATDAVEGTRLSLSEPTCTESCSPDEGSVDSQEPVCLELADCTDPVDAVLPHLTSTVWSRGLGQLVHARNITTVGHLSLLTAVEVQNLPIRSPKVDTLKKVLQNFIPKWKCKREKASAPGRNSLPGPISTETVSPVDAPPEANVNTPSNLARADPKDSVSCNGANKSIIALSSPDGLESSSHSSTTMSAIKIKVETNAPEVTAVPQSSPLHPPDKCISPVKLHSGKTVVEEPHTFDGSSSDSSIEQVVFITRVGPKCSEDEDTDRDTGPTVDGNDWCGSDSIRLHYDGSSEDDDRKRAGPSPRKSAAADANRLPHLKGTVFDSGSSLESKIFQVFSDGNAADKQFQTRDDSTCSPDKKESSEEDGPKRDDHSCHRLETTGDIDSSSVKSKPDNVAQGTDSPALSTLEPCVSSIIRDCEMLCIQDQLNVIERLSQLVRLRLSTDVKGTVPRP